MVTYAYRLATGETKRPPAAQSTEPAREQSANRPSTQRATV
jgi:hypothetical protein